MHLRHEYFGAGTKVMLHGWEKVTPLGAERSGAVINLSINNAQVRSDRDIDVIVDQVASRLGAHLDWVGGRG